MSGFEVAIFWFLLFTYFFNKTRVTAHDMFSGRTTRMTGNMAAAASHRYTEGKRYVNMDYVW